MIKDVEGNIQFEFSKAKNCRKLDDSEQHGLSHCMKAVDFVVEEEDKTLFIEIKDPDDPKALSHGNRTKFFDDFTSGKLDQILSIKYRDSFLYEWACGRGKKPIHYLVLIAFEELDDALLMARTEKLQRQIPFSGPTSGVWKRKIVAGCTIFNLKSWNRTFSHMRASRIQ